MSALWREDLVPYRSLVEKLSLIEVSHAAYKAYDYEFQRPASFSPSVVEGLLRLKLGYEGIALADARAASCAGRIEAGEAAVRAIAAGCDLVLIPGGDQAIEAVSASLERAYDVGRLPLARVEQALDRVRSAKKKLAPSRQEPSPRDWRHLARDFEELD